MLGIRLLCLAETRFAMLVAPSILTCDFARFGEELDFVKQSGADMVHLDVMDGGPKLKLGTKKDMHAHK